MALTKESMADKILIRVAACNANFLPANDAIIRPCLEAFCQGIIDEFLENAQIVMDEADFNILPGTFKDSTNTLITGEGENKAFDLTGKIK